MKLENASSARLVRVVATCIALSLGAALVACGSVERGDDGSILNRGNLDVATMRVGDCFQNLHPDITLLDDVTGVPCSQPHDNEVFHMQPIEGDTWPGDDNVERFAVDVCFSAFDTYVGAPYEESQLDFSWFNPTSRAWEQLGYRDVVCFLFDPSGEQLTGSMKGSRQ